MVAPQPSARLHGYPVSNWFNCARAVMIEKGLGDDYIACRASGDADFLAKSAMGKIPWLETPQGGIAETIAIIEYLEGEFPALPIMPEANFEKAKVRQIVNIVQLYIEAPMRDLYPATFMGPEHDASVVTRSLAVVARAFIALDQLCDFGPFLRGNRLTSADLALFYTLELGERAARHLAATSFFENRPMLQQWDAAIRSRESTKLVLADFAPAFADYCAQRNATWDEAQYQEERFSHA